MDKEDNRVAKIKELENAIINTNAKNQTLHKLLMEEQAKVKQRDKQLAVLMRSSKTINNAMCGTKKSFFTKAEATKAASSFNGRVYECPICACFHTTSKTKNNY